MTPMFPASRRNRQTLLTTQGDAVAGALCEGHTGTPENDTGWWAGLQGAADLSRNDPEVLQPRTSR